MLHIHNKSLHHQRGISFFVVIVLVMLSMLLALWGARTSLFSEMIVGNDADYQRAFEAAQAGTRRPLAVTLSATTMPGGRLLMTLEDSGTGLSPGGAAQLFSAFQSTKSSGLGLGLVISKAIVETHGGELWGEISDHGVFKLILPTDAASA